MVTMPRYLLEFRFIDRRAKHYMKSLARQIYSRYHVGPRHYVPHISLVGGFETSNENKLIKDIFRICNSYPVMRFGIKGFSTFEENRVVFLDIDPSDNLKQFRWEMARKLDQYYSLKRPYDFHSKDEFAFHSTVAMDIPPHKFNSIKNYIFSMNIPLRTDYVLVRVTLLKSSKILREYDFLQRKMLTRFEARNPQYYQKTENLLKDYLDNRYDPNRSITKESRIPVKKAEISPSYNIHRKNDSFKDFSPTVRPASSIQRFLDFFKSSKIYVISDLHLDHANIIRYCNRPFPDTRMMNRELVTNWNSIVKRKDTVYFLGDLVYGRSSHGAEYWIKRLHGNKKYLKGNHDEGVNVPFLNNPWLVYRGKKFYLIHDPDEIPVEWDGWIIHGHHHNNDLKRFPFINGEAKTINVSVELIDYKPLDLEVLFDLDYEGITYMETINSKPLRFS